MSEKNYYDERKANILSKLGAGTEGILRAGWRKAFVSLLSECEMMPSTAARELGIPYHVLLKYLKDNNHKEVLDLIHSVRHGIYLGRLEEPERNDPKAAKLIELGLKHLTNITEEESDIDAPFNTEEVDKLIEYRKEISTLYQEIDRLIEQNKVLSNELDKLSS